MENIEQLEEGQGIRNLATIRRIEEIWEIEGADRIVGARIGGWRCVTQKSNGFKVGDPVIYFEIDSILPADNEEFAFLEGKPLKTKKFKGELAQGLIMPLSVLTEEQYSKLVFDTGSSLLVPKCDETLLIGQDLTELLGVKKYIKQMPGPSSNFGNSKIKGLFPNFLFKTDEERVQNIGHILDAREGTTCFVTEKLDGSSMTVFVKDGELGVCSRNYELQEAEGNRFWDTFRASGLDELLLESGRNLAFQGELIGPGVQGNHYQLEANQIRVFNIYDIDAGRFLNYEEFIKFKEDIRFLSVPILAANYNLPHSTDMDTLLKEADGMSALNKNVRREGIVIRPLEEEYINRFGRFSFKVVSNKWLEKNG